MTWLSDFLFDLKMAWYDFCFYRDMHREFKSDLEGDLLRLREKGL